MRRSGKKLVLDKHPHARLERHRGNDRSTWFLVRLPDTNGRPRQMWTGCGDTSAQAWNDAANRLGLFKVKP